MQRNAMNNRNLSPQERFDYAVNVVLKHEGGYSNNPNDPGGPTNYGISLRFIKEIGLDINNDSQTDLNDVKEIYFSDAIDIYKNHWWDKYHYNNINSLRFATKIFDMSVNLGPKTSHKIVQRCCNYLGHAPFKEIIPVDGVFGIKTLTCLNELCKEEEVAQELMEEIINEQKWFYHSLAEKNPTLKVFLEGWMKRAQYQGP